MVIFCCRRRGLGSWTSFWSDPFKALLQVHSLVAEGTQELPAYSLLSFKSSFGTGTLVSVRR